MASNSLHRGERLRCGEHNLRRGEPETDFSSSFLFVTANNSLRRGEWQPLSWQIPAFVVENLFAATNNFFRAANLRLLFQLSLIFFHLHLRNNLSLGVMMQQVQFFREILYSCCNAHLTLLQFIIRAYFLKDDYDTLS